MHLINVVLFVHILVAIAAFSVAAILHTAQWVARGATSTATLKAWKPVIHRLEPLFPILALVLFGLGAWLLGLSDGEFRWGDGWVITSIVGLAAMEVVGGALIAPRTKKLIAAITDAADGPVDEPLNAAVMNPVFWATTHFATGVALGIVFLMATKPSGAAAVAIVVIAAALGTALGAAAARTPGPRFRMVDAAVASAGVGDRQ
jgi:hypothetical protein